MTVSAASANYSLDRTATRAVFGGSGAQVSLSRLDVIARVRQVSGGMTLGNVGIAGGIDLYVLSIVALKERNATAEALCR